MKIIFIGNKNFYFLIQETTDKDILYLENVNNLEKIKEKYILIIDNELQEYQEIKSSDLLIKFIIFTNKIEVDCLNYLLESKLNFQIFKKEKYIFLEDILKKISIKKVRTQIKKLIISDITKEVYLNIEDILYFSYDRYMKKSFAKVDKSIFYSRKALGEIEEELKELEMFQRIERSFIVNMNKIFYINFKDEYIKFKNEETIYINKKKLKEISEIMEKEIKKF